MKSFNLLTVFLLILTTSLLSVQSIAQPGTFDPTFNPTDLGFGSGQGTNRDIRTLAIQTDGKVIVGGSFDNYNGVAQTRIMRLNANGSLDAGFNTGSGIAGGVYALAVQPDGKVVIAGDFNSYNGTARRSIVRVNTDGTVDATFNPGTGVEGGVLALQLQSDGKMLIGGYFTSYNGTARSGIARLNADGILDGGFNPGTGATGGQVSALAVQGDGKVIVGGQFTGYNGTARNRLARVNADGSLDATLNPGTGTNAIIWTMAFQPDGKVIIGGDFTTYNGTGRNRIARVNADGSLDASFNPLNGISGRVFSLALQPDGKVNIAGEYSSYNSTPRANIARANSDGSLDLSFNPGTGAAGPVYFVALQSDGKVILGGDFPIYNGTTKNRISRVHPDGSLDNTFNPATGANNFVTRVALQPDGKVIFGGDFTTYNGTSRNKIARANANGTLDGDFNPGTGVNPNSLVNSMAVQDDGKVIIGGNFAQYNGTARSNIARLNTDGTLDMTFNPGSGANSNILAMAIQPDGKVIIAGFFSNYNGTPRNNIARVNANGSLDATFDPGTGAAGTILAMALQPDGKVIIGGILSSYNGTPCGRIVRANADGSLDATFQGTGADNAIWSLILQADGKVIAGGDFTTFNGTGRNRIARLNANGTLDASFNPGTGANGTVRSVAIRSDGKLIVGGAFTTFNGTGRNRIARLNTDGSFDAAFDPGSGANGNVLSFALQPDGKMIIGGDFTAYNGTGRNRVARIDGGPVVPPPPVYVTVPANNATNIQTSVNVTSVVFPGASSYTIELSETSNFAVVAFTMTGASNTQSFSGLKYNTKYYNRVKTNTTEGYGEVRNFTTLPASNLAFVTAPANGAVNVPTIVSVVSNVVPGAASYTIELSETNDFAVVAFTSTGATPVRPFSGLKYNQQYFNRVTTDLSPGIFGQVRSFTTMSAASIAVVTAPANGAVNVPTVVSVTSNVVPGASSYTIELSETNDFAVVAFTSTGASPVRPFAGLKYNQLYFNRVTTNVSGGAFGLVRSFTTMSAASLAVVTAPANGAVNVPTVVSISSNSVPGASSYTIELSETNDFAVVAFSSTGASPVRPFFGLKYNQQYFNRVTTDVSGGAFGLVRSFTTQPATNLAFVTAPANGAVNVATVVSIVSNVVPGAGSYTIELSETNDFAVVAFSSTGSSPVRPFFGLKYNQQYFNRVTTDLSPGAFGLVKSFTTQPASNVAFVNSPANGATGVGTIVNVVSNVVAGAGSYTIELSTTSNFSVIDFTQTGSGPVLLFAGLNVSTTYFNRVLTDLSGGVYGAVRSFTTKSTPGARMAFPEAVTAVEDDRADFELKLYSNPFRERLVVVVESKLVDQAELNLMDMNGRTVHASLAKTNTEIEIGNSLSSGIYLLRANAGPNIKTIRWSSSSSLDDLDLIKRSQAS